MKEIKDRDIKPIKLAFDYSDSKVLVWAEIDNESFEDQLILSQAKINAKFSSEGFCISTTIVEKERWLDYTCALQEISIRWPLSNLMYCKQRKTLILSV